MTLQGWLQIGMTLLIGFLISIPVGRYLARMATGQKTPLDRLFDPIDNGIYLLIGRRICGQMRGWHEIGVSWLVMIPVARCAVAQE